MVHDSNIILAVRMFDCMRTYVTICRASIGGYLCTDYKFSCCKILGRSLKDNQSHMVEVTVDKTKQPSLASKCEHLDTSNALRMHLTVDAKPYHTHTRTKVIVQRSDNDLNETKVYSRSFSP